MMKGSPYEGLPLFLCGFAQDFRSGNQIFQAGDGFFNIAGLKTAVRYIELLKEITAQNQGGSGYRDKMS